MQLFYFWTPLRLSPTRGSWARSALWKRSRGPRICDPHGDSEQAAGVDADRHKHSDPDGRPDFTKLSPWLILLGTAAPCLHVQPASSSALGCDVHAGETDSVRGFSNILKTLLSCCVLLLSQVWGRLVVAEQTLGREYESKSHILVLSQTSGSGLREHSYWEFTDDQYQHCRRRTKQTCRL